jgi:predicted enzyme related to lactoylglutathione lyase
MWRKMMDPVVHFEVPYDDRVRISKFYESAFGWHTQVLGEEMGNYVVATTTETGESGPTKPGAINGGFYSKEAGGPAPCPVVVIAVKDIKESVKKVIDAGGQVLGQPTEIPGVGTVVSFVDTEGNRLSMLQPIPRNWHALRAE